MTVARIICWVGLVLFLGTGGRGVGGAEITVFAAASLTESLKEIALGFEKQTGDKIIFNFGASSTLARQIEEGAPADIFFSADEAKMNGLEEKAYIVKATRRNLLSNTLVIIVAARDGAAVHAPADLARPAVKRIALGDPKAVPIGVYAREYLEKLGLWEAVRPKVVAMENVRSALAAVEAGNADASIVYKTDALISKEVVIRFEVPSAEGPAIRYPVAMVKGARAADGARRLLTSLESDGGLKVFKQHGFLEAGGPSRR